jgi:23S rRNA (guanosine2251-2'-O)-methyltransferase
VGTDAPRHHRVPARAPGYDRGMGARILFGFHAVTVRLKTAPQSVLEVYVDSQRRDARMRQFVERAREAGAKVVDSDAAQLQRLAGGPRHQGVVAR